MIRTLILTFSLATLAFAADISGTWNMTVETDMGTGTPTFVFKQDGENLTGTYSGQLGEAKVTGTVKGEVVEFSFKAAPGGDEITAKYTAKLSGNTSMKGTVDLGGLAKGNFSGTRK